MGRRAAPARKACQSVSSRAIAYVCSRSSANACRSITPRAASADGAIQSRASRPRFASSTCLSAGQGAMPATAQTNCTATSCASAMAGKEIGQLVKMRAHAPASTGRAAKCHPQHRTLPAATTLFGTSSRAPPRTARAVSTPVTTGDGLADSGTQPGRPRSRRPSS